LGGFKLSGVSGPRRSTPPLLACTLVLAGCAVSPQTRLLNDLAARLDRAGDLAYTAEYRVPGGSALLSQSDSPRRAAFTFGGGVLLVTQDRTARCEDSADATRCTLTPAPARLNEPALDLLATDVGTGRGGPAPTAAELVSPVTAMRQLSAAVTDGRKVRRYDETVAGVAATCVEVAEPGGFRACITADGILGRYAGTVRDTPVVVELTRYSTRADPQAFTLPRGAAIDDRRPR
jgi:hypothetical protein